MVKSGQESSSVDIVNVPKGRIHILKERCKGCSFCVEFCPKDVLQLSREYNLKGYHPPYVKKPEACISCNLCMMLCPDFAIYCEDKEPL